MKYSSNSCLSKTIPPPPRKVNLILSISILLNLCQVYVIFPEFARGIRTKLIPGITAFAPVALAGVFIFGEKAPAYNGFGERDIDSVLTKNPCEYLSTGIKVPKAGLEFDQSCFGYDRSLLRALFFNSSVIPHHSPFSSIICWSGTKSGSESNPYFGKSELLSQAVFTIRKQLISPLD